MSLGRIMGVFLFFDMSLFQYLVQGGTNTNPRGGGWEPVSIEGDESIPPGPASEIISARIHFLFPAAKYDAEKEAKEIKESKDKQLEKIEEARRKAAEDKGQYNKVNNIIIPTLSCIFTRDSYTLC